MLGRAFRSGPDGTLEGKFAAEHPIFIHYGCAFYVASSLAFLEGEDGARSWNIPGVILSGSIVRLDAPFLDFVRIATLAVRNYHDEF